MRKLSIYAALLLAVSTIFIGCGKEKKEEKEASKKAHPEYEATIDDMFTCGSKYSGELLVVNLEVTNKSEEYLDSFSPAYSLQASVDGEILETTYLSEDNPYYVKESKIKSGETGTAQAAFSLEDIDYDDDSEVEFILTSHDLVSYKEIVVIEETVSMSDIDMVESESEVEVTVDNVTVTDDGEGNNLLVIDYTFTNNSDEATSFSSAVEDNLFQDGIKLERTYLPYNHPLADDTESNSGNEIKSGASIPVRKVYGLKSASNVEIQLVDYTSFDGAVILETEIEVGTAEEENNNSGDTNASEEKPSLDDESGDEL